MKIRLVVPPFIYLGVLFTPVAASLVCLLLVVADHVTQKAVFWIVFPTLLIVMSCFVLGRFGLVVTPQYAEYLDSRRVRNRFRS